jgi:hypothetical protein
MGTSQAFFREIFLESMRRVPAGPIDVMSLLARFAVAIHKRTLNLKALNLEAAITIS